MDREKLLLEISKVIVDNRRELVDKLDELELACSCTIFDASEKDLADIVAENMGNEKFSKWISEKIAAKNPSISADGASGGDIAGAAANILKVIGDIIKGGQQNKLEKQKYKAQIAEAAQKYRLEREKSKRVERATNTWMIVGGSLLLIGVGAWIYYSSKQPAPVINKMAA